MTAVSRLALALPFAVALTAPAQAQWFEFSLTTTDGFILSGRTADGDATEDVGYKATSLAEVAFFDSSTSTTYSLQGNSLFLFDGGLNTGSSTLDRSASNTYAFFSGGTVSFRDVTNSEDRPLYWGLSDWSTLALPSTQNYFALNTTVQTLFNRDGTLQASPDFDYELTLNTSGETLRSLADSDGNVATLVPEINGSGFAYIAFILGALGLWLYSGAGRARSEEMPSAA